METSDESADELEEGAMEAADAPSAEFPDEADAGESEEASENRPPASSGAERRAPDYKAYTTKFDEVVNAEDLCDPEELQRLRDYLDKQLQNLSSVVSRLANRLQRRLMAQQIAPGNSISRRACWIPRACRASSSIRSSRCRSSGRRTRTSAIPS